jgi:hypothetical protein
MTDFNPIDEESIKKTIFGVVESLDAFFEQYIYCAERFDKGSGTSAYSGRIWTPHPKGFYFCASEYDSMKTWIKPPACKGALYVKPKDGIVRPLQNVCCNAAFQAFKIIPWRHTGHALVTATDVLMIAHPWLGFVPLASIPEINAQNTPIWSGSHMSNFKEGHCEPKAE